MPHPIPLTGLDRDKVPEELRAERYFDFTAHPFRHRDLFEPPWASSVTEVLHQIDRYTKRRLAELVQQAESQAAGSGSFRRLDPPPGCLTRGRARIYAEGDVVFLPRLIVGPDTGEPGTVILEDGAHIIDAALYLDAGGISVGARTAVDTGSCLSGPIVLGAENDIRPGCLIRGRVVTGDGCTLRCETKNAVFMDRCEYPHPSYVGDSLLGYHSHFGNQVTAANFRIFSPGHASATILLRAGGQTYDTGLTKLGVVMGDYCQVGCNSVSDPGTFLGPHTLVYPLTYIRMGFYEARRIIKNKPWKRGVVEISTLRTPGDE